MILVVSGSLFLPATMMIYCSLYLLPILLVGCATSDGKMARTAWIAFFALAIPLQVPLLLGRANPCFSSVAVVDLVLIAVLKDVRETPINVKINGGSW